MWPYIILQLVCIFTWDVLESRAPKKGFVCPWLFGGKTWGRVHSGRQEKLRWGWVAEMVTAGGPRAASFKEVAKSSELSSWGCGRKHLPFDLIPHWVRLSQHYCTLVARVCVCVCVCVCRMGSCRTFRPQNGKGLGLALGRHCLHQVSQSNPSADH